MRGSMSTNTSDARPPGFAIWLTGLPASGKTTLARALQARLAQAGIATQLLDSDALRRVLTPNPTYAPAERDHFYGVLAWLAALLTANGVNVIIAATAAQRAYRDAARAQIARFAEVYVSTPLDVCAARDPKGLYAQAASNSASRLPGRGVAYEPPLRPEVTFDTQGLTPADAATQLWQALAQRGFWATQQT